MEKNNMYLIKLFKKIEPNINQKINNLYKQRFPENFKFVSWLYNYLKKIKKVKVRYHPLEERCQAINKEITDRNLLEYIDNHLLPNELFFSDLRNSKLKKKMKKKKKTEPKIIINKEFVNDLLNKKENGENVNLDLNEIDFGSLNKYTVNELESKWELMNVIADTKQERNIIIDILKNIDNILINSPDSELKDIILDILKKSPNYELNYN